MTLKVVLDAKHRILAVVHMPAPDAPSPVMTARPVLGPGMREVDIVVPAAHLERKPMEHRRALHVDATGAVTYRA
ncbi:MAG: hypothetical protein ABUS79_26730 [Pseudomonadota bacterium]